MNFGLERIHKLLDALNRPDERTKIVHVAGTNGKGSVCAYIASVLYTCGYTVGRFNSPHLIEPRDSINVNGQPISQSLYDEAFAHVNYLNHSQAIDASSFECSVGAAFYVFDKFNLDFVVLEVGLGGLLDATNAIRQPVMTIVTQIGLDHAHILGHTLEEIATAKAGIMKPGCPAVLAPQQSNVMKTLTHYADKTGSPYRKALPAEYLPENRFKLDIDQVQYIYPIRLKGDYQRDNSATAVTALHWMHKKGLISMTPEQLAKGMEETRWPGRLDWVEENLERYGLDRILVDGAHNPPATRELRKYVDSLHSGRIIWIMGTTAGKDIQEMMNELIKENDIVLAVPFSQPMGMPWIHSTAPQDIIKEAQNLKAETVCCSDLPDALRKAGNAVTSQDSVVLCGSLYLVADLYRLLL